MHEWEIRTGGRYQIRSCPGTGTVTGHRETDPGAWVFLVCMDHDGSTRGFRPGAFVREVSTDLLCAYRR